MIKPIQLGGTGAVYKRVSTDKQDAERQDASVGRWLARHGAAVNGEHVYVDEGWARADAVRRPAFQRLLREVEAGRVQWIVVDRPDRFAAKDKFEGIHFLYLLREGGCRLYTVDDRELTASDTASSLMVHLDYDQSERELKEKAVRTIEGKVEKAKRGEWQGGKIPYGMAVVCYRLDNKADLVEQWRVEPIRKDLRVKVSPDGMRREYHGTRNFPASEQNEILQLRPSDDPAKLEVVRWVFETYLNETTTPSAIARHLNQRGTEPPAYGERWREYHVSYMLRHPCYTGAPVWNRKSVADYMEFTGGDRVERQPGGKKRIHHRDDWIVPAERFYAPVVDPSLWEAVQKKLASVPVAPKSKPETYTYAGLIYCGNCNAKMVGTKMVTSKKTGKVVLTYVCGTYNNWGAGRAACPCKAFKVKQTVINDAVRAVLDDTGRALAELTPHVRAKKPQALIDALKKMVDAHKAMRERLDVPLVAGYGEDGEQVTGMLIPDMRIAGGGVIVMPESDTAELQRLYRWKHTDDEYELEDRLDTLRARQDELIDTLRKIPATATRALTKVQRELDEVDTQIGEAERNAENAADAYVEAEREYDRLSRQWDAAQAALASESQSRRAVEAIRRAISQITVTFRPTGRKNPAGEVADIAIKTNADCGCQGTSPPAIRSRSAF